MDDIVLDIPRAHKHLDNLLNMCCRADVISLGLRQKAPFRLVYTRSEMSKIELLQKQFWAIYYFRKKRYFNVRLGFECASLDWNQFNDSDLNNLKKVSRKISVKSTKSRTLKIGCYSHMYNSKTQVTIVTSWVFPNFITFFINLKLQ